jgi:CRP/FNR family transcriptional regulator
MRSNVFDFPKLAVSCGECQWSRSCVAHGFAVADAVEEGPGLRCSAPLKRNTHVFQQGEPLEFLYILRSGSAKSYFDNADGLEQIVSFHYPGDLLGFDAVANGHHQTAVVALETASLCRIPFSSIESVAARTPKLWAEVMRSAARQMMEKNNHALLLGQKSAQARFASLLLYLSNRFAARGCSRTEFNLSMPRQDIANYLSLAVETVSRLFGDLQTQGIIAVDRRYVHILSLEKLRAIAGESANAAARTGLR